MKKRILICDDDDGIREVTAQILEKHGFNVMCISQAHNIGNVIAVFKPNLLLMDVMLYKENGVIIVPDIKNHPATKNLPVLLFTVANNPEELSAISGADGFIRKPFEIHDLIQRIEAKIE